MLLAPMIALLMVAVPPQSSMARLPMNGAVVAEWLNARGGSAYAYLGVSDGVHVFRTTYALERSRSLTVGKHFFTTVCGDPEFRPRINAGLRMRVVEVFRSSTRAAETIRSCDAGLWTIFPTESAAEPGTFDVIDRFSLESHDHADIHWLRTLSVFHGTGGTEKYALQSHRILCEDGSFETDESKFYSAQGRLLRTVQSGDESKDLESHRIGRLIDQYACRQRTPTQTILATPLEFASAIIGRARADETR